MIEGAFFESYSYPVCEYPEQMIDIPRHKDSEGVSSLEHEIVIYIPQETVLVPESVKCSRGSLHVAVRMATTVSLQLLKYELISA